MEPHIPTVATRAVALAAGARFAPPRRTCNRIYLATQGSGNAQCGDLSVSWNRGDVIAVPTWTPLTLTASTDATLVEVSDEPVMRKLGFYREG